MVVRDVRAAWDFKTFITRRDYVGGNRKDSKAVDSVDQSKPMDPKNSFTDNGLYVSVNRAANQKQVM